MGECSETFDIQAAHLKNLGQALISAVIRDDIEEIKRLIQQKAPLNAADKDGDTPLLWAASLRYETIAKLLIDAEADIDAQNDDEKKTALIIAAQTGQTDLAQYLLDHGADTRKRDAQGYDACDWARQGGYSFIIEMLENPSPERIRSILRNTHTLKRNIPAFPRFL